MGMPRGRKFVMMTSLASILVMIAAASAQEPPTSQASTDEPAPFQQEKVVVKTGKYELDGILTLPNGDGPFPAVVLVHGSGPHDADETIGPNKPFRDLAEGLSVRGIAVLRYEKRTLKYAMQMALKKVTLKNEVIDDALSAVSLLKKHARIDPQRIFLLGHSLGGTCAPLIAARDKAIAGLILMSGTPRSLLDLVDEQFEYITHADGKVTTKEAKTVEDIHRTTQLIRDGKYDEIKTPLLGAPTPYWVELHKLDVLTPARQFGKPIRILGGGRDYQVTEKCFAAWKTGLAGLPNITYKWYKRNNHLMMPGDGEGKCTPDEYFKPNHVSKKVIRDIATWITSVK